MKPNYSNTTYPSAALLNAATDLMCLYDGIQPGANGNDLFQFTLHRDAADGFTPTVYVSVKDPHPVARLRDLISDAIRKNQPRN